MRDSFEASAYRRVRALLVDAVDHLPPAIRERRVDQAVGLVVMSLAANEHALAGGRRTPLSPDEQTADLIQACCGLLTAPTTQEDPC